MTSETPPMPIRRGDLFWIAADATRGALAGTGAQALPGSAHPHLVVQDDVFNQSRIHSVVVCALSSNLKRATEPGNVLLDAGEGQLSRQSVVVVSQISAVDKQQLGARIGALSAQRVEQVLAGLRFQQAAFLAGR